MEVDHWPGQPDKVGRLLISFDRSAGMDGAGKLDPTATIELVVTFLSGVLKADKKLKAADQEDIDWLKGLTKDEPETILVLLSIWLWLHPTDELLSAQEILGHLPKGKAHDTSDFRKRLRVGRFPGALNWGVIGSFPRAQQLPLGDSIVPSCGTPIKRIEEVRTKPRVGRQLGTTSNTSNTIGSVLQKGHPGIMEKT